jgi:hypothetical protein
VALMNQAIEQLVSTLALFFLANLTNRVIVWAFCPKKGDTTLPFSPGYWSGKIAISCLSLKARWRQAHR